MYHDMPLRTHSINIRHCQIKFKWKQDISTFRQVQYKHIYITYYSHMCENDVLYPQPSQKHMCFWNMGRQTSSNICNTCASTHGNKNWWWQCKKWSFRYNIATRADLESVWRVTCRCDGRNIAWRRAQIHNQYTSCIHWKSTPKFCNLAETSRMVIKFDNNGYSWQMQRITWGLFNKTRECFT